MSRGRGRRAAWMGFAGLTATCAIVGANYRALAARYVTYRALEEALRLCEPGVNGEEAVKRIELKIRADFGAAFRDGYLDRAYLVGRMPIEAVTADALPVWIVMAAVVTSLRTPEVQGAGPGPDLRDSEVAGLNLAEIQGTIALLSEPQWTPRTLEILFNLLTSDVALLSGFPVEWTRRLKAGFLQAISSADLAAGAQARSLLRHTNGKVRAMAMLALRSHRDLSLTTTVFRAGLADPFAPVRIAAAGLLAERNDASGFDALVAGLEHERWEVRWWCLQALGQLQKSLALDWILLRSTTDPDPWVRGEAAELFGRLDQPKLACGHCYWPNKEWRTEAPEGLTPEPGALDRISSSLGGNGCVVWHGCRVHSWGRIDESTDLGAASESISTYFALHELAYAVAWRSSFGDPVLSFLDFQDGPLLRAASFSARDLARFGWLYARRRWPTRSNEVLKLVSAHLHSRLASTVLGSRSASPDSALGLDPIGSYSLGWWTNDLGPDGMPRWPDVPIDAFCTLGHGGAVGVAALPSRHLVVTWNHGSIQGREQILDALRVISKAVPEAPQTAPPR